VNDLRVKPALAHLLQGLPLRSKARSLSLIAPVFALGPGLPCAVCDIPFVKPPPGALGSSLVFFLPGLASSTPGALPRFVPGLGPGMPRRFWAGGRVESAFPGDDIVGCGDVAFGEEPFGVSSAVAVVDATVGNPLSSDNIDDLIFNLIIRETGEVVAAAAAAAGFGFGLGPGFLRCLTGGGIGAGIAGAREPFGEGESAAGGELVDEFPEVAIETSCCQRDPPDTRKEAHPLHKRASEAIVQYFVLGVGQMDTGTWAGGAVLMNFFVSQR